MNNLFSKSTGTYEKLVQQLETVLTEQRHQRIDLATISRDIKILINTAKLQRQVDDYFERDTGNREDSETIQDFEADEYTSEQVPDVVQSDKKV